jgi:hypothetical protein
MSEHVVSIKKFKHTCREGRSEHELLAVCSRAFHRRLAAVHWGRLISTIGVQKWPDEPEMKLGNCPVCHTTLAKPPKISQ